MFISTLELKEEKPIDKELLDLYSDYLICSFSYTTATGLAGLLDNTISHDMITRFLGARPYTSKDLWQLVKPIIREIENDKGAISFDDTIQEKPYTDENDIVAWHFDHSKGRSVKGVNILNCLYHAEKATIPLAFEVVKKDTPYIDVKTGKKKRKASVTKNELFRTYVTVCVKNNILFRYILGDTWFSSKENMEHALASDKHFIFALKSNRLVALSKEDKRAGVFKRMEELNFEENATKRCFLKGIRTPVLIAKRVFTNKDKSAGILYLATSDLTLNHTAITATYHKRWGVEEYHKSLKSNVGLAKSPTKTAMTQANHFFASIYAYVKLELLRMKTSLNHFALKSKLYLKALTKSFQELQELRSPAVIRA